MKIRISKLTLLILLSLATNANGEFILPDGANASLVGARARAAAAAGDDRLPRHTLRNSITSNNDVSDKCGHVEVGNTLQSINGLRNLTVIVTGDILNAGNVCK